MMQKLIFAAAILAWISPALADSQQDEFFSHIRTHCGQSFAGEPVIYEEGDPWLGQPIIMHIRDCEEDVIRIPLHLGEDRSRTWILTRKAGGIQLSHDHRHEDGTPEELSPYGGMTADVGSATAQAFPVDATSKALFTVHKRTASLDNIWTITIHPGTEFTYRLTRPGLDFKIAFDLTKPVPTPLPAWGSED